MSKSTGSPDPSDLIALINEITAYWKAIAERNFKKIHPSSSAEEFEQRWPGIRSNFYLAETVRTLKILRSLSITGRNN